MKDATRLKPTKTFEEKMQDILAFRSEIYGLCALWIIFFHISDRVPVPFSPNIITPLIRMGNCCVDIFLFLSGYCLVLSWEKNFNLTVKSRFAYFYKRRFLRLIPPYIVLSTPFYFWKYMWGFSAPKVDLGEKFNLIGFLGDLSTVNFWLKGMQTTWFVCAILVFYLFFPLLYGICKKHFLVGLSLILACYAALIAMIFLDMNLFWKIGIAVSRIPAFVSGITLAIYRKKINTDSVFYRIIRTLLLCAFIVFVFLFPIKNFALKHFNRFRSPVIWCSYLYFIPGFLLCLKFLFERLPAFLRKAIYMVGGGYFRVVYDSCLYTSSY